MRIFRFFLLVFVQVSLAALNEAKARSFCFNDHPEPRVSSTGRAIWPPTNRNWIAEHFEAERGRAGNLRDPWAQVMGLVDSSLNSYVNDRTQLGRVMDSQRPLAPEGPQSILRFQDPSIPHWEGSFFQVLAVQASRSSTGGLNQSGVTQAPLGGAIVCQTAAISPVGRVQRPAPERQQVRPQVLLFGAPVRETRSAGSLGEEQEGGNPLNYLRYFYDFYGTTAPFGFIWHIENRMDLHFQVLFSRPLSSRSHIIRDRLGQRWMLQLTYEGSQRNLNFQPEWSQFFCINEVSVTSQDEASLGSSSVNSALLDIKFRIPDPSQMEWRYFQCETSMRVLF